MPGGRNGDVWGRVSGEDLTFLARQLDRLDVQSSVVVLRWGRGVGAMSVGFILTVRSSEWG